MFRKFWQWLKRVNRDSGDMLITGLTAGPIAGLIVGLIAGLTAGLTVVGLIAGLIAGLIIGLIAGLIIGLIAGLTAGLIFGLTLFAGAAIVVGLIWLVPTIGWLPVAGVTGGIVGALALARILWREMRAAIRRRKRWYTALHESFHSLDETLRVFLKRSADLPLFTDTRVSAEALLAELSQAGREYQELVLARDGTDSETLKKRYEERMEAITDTLDEYRAVYANHLATLAEVRESEKFERIVGSSPERLRALLAQAQAEAEGIQAALETSSGGDELEREFADLEREEEPTSLPRRKSSSGQ